MGGAWCVLEHSRKPRDEGEVIWVRLGDMHRADDIGPWSSTDVRLYFDCHGEPSGSWRWWVTMVVVKLSCGSWQENRLNKVKEKLNRSMRDRLGGPS